MAKRWNLKIAILVVAILLSGPSASSQSSPAAESLIPHDPAVEASSIVNSDNLQSVQPITIDKTYLRYLEPTPIEKFARSLQYQYQLQEQPAVLVASAGGSTQVIANPNKWLQQHSVILQLSEWFPKTTDMSQLVLTAYNDLDAKAKRGNPPIVLKRDDLCPKAGNTFECLAAGGSFWGRMFSSTKLTFSVAQRDEVQQGVLVPNLTASDAWTWGGELEFDPASFFISASNWKDAVSTFSKIPNLDTSGIDANDERKCFEKKRIETSTMTSIKTTQFMLRSQCVKEFGKARLYPSSSQGTWTALAAVLMPKYNLKVSSQFDFLKQGGILVQNPLLQRSLKSMTFTWDLRKLIPSTADRLAVATTGLPSLPDSAKDESEVSKLCIVTSGTSKSYFEVPHDSNMNVCRQLAKILDSGSRYALACISTKSGSMGTWVDKDEAAVDSNKPPTNNCGW